MRLFERLQQLAARARAAGRAELASGYEHALQIAKHEIFQAEDGSELEEMLEEEALEQRRQIQTRKRAENAARSLRARGLQTFAARAEPVRRGTGGLRPADE